MNIWLISSYDYNGGAARSVYRLAVGLKKIGINITLLVQFTSKYESWILLACNVRFLNTLFRKLDIIFQNLYIGYKGTPWSNNFFSLSNLNPIKKGIDLIHLNWVGNSFISLSNIKRFKGVPIVWTMHDSWAFTGGCHIPHNCTNFYSKCGNCPQLNSASDFDLSRFNFQIKSKAYAGLNLTVVTPSNWLARSVKNSTLLQGFPVRVIPNGIDSSVFKFRKMIDSRLMLGLPGSNFLIGYSGCIENISDLNKGATDILKIADFFSSKKSYIETPNVIFFGENISDDFKFNVPFRSFGTLEDDDMISLVMSSINILVVPSRSENLSNTILEGLASGTPVVAYNTGGNSDMITHKENGYLAELGNVDDLIYGILWVKNNLPKSDSFSIGLSQKIANNFSSDSAASAYKKLYLELLNKKV